MRLDFLSIQQQRLVYFIADWTTFLISCCRRQADPRARAPEDGKFKIDTESYRGPNSTFHRQFLYYVIGSLLLFSSQNKKGKKEKGKKERKMTSTKQEEKKKRGLDEDGT